jgi:hypothetical protein
MTGHDQEDKKRDDKQIFENKNKLLEIYIIASGLIIAATQSTISLISINTSANVSNYSSTIETTKSLIECSNLAFFLLLFVVLVYYTGMFNDNVSYTILYTTIISISFSFILTIFLKLNTNLPIISYFALFFSMSIAILLFLAYNSILMQKLNDEAPKLPKFIRDLISRTLKTTSIKQFASKIWN